MESTKELTKLMGIRERLENEYEYVAFKCRHGIGDVEANREEAYRLGRILGIRLVDIEVDTRIKNNDFKCKCKNPKNKDVLEYIEHLKIDISKSEKECEIFTVCAVSEDAGVITGSLGEVSSLAAAIAFLINDIEKHSIEDVSLIPMIKAKYTQLKVEGNDEHDGDD